DGATSTFPCIGRVANHLALPRQAGDVVNTIQGGYYGTQTELAVALYRAVSAWMMAPAATREPRLVLNLRVGWDSITAYGGAYPGNNVASLAGPVRSVHAAITHAVCQGALVVSAAGNVSAGPSPTTGPMYPAGWERKPAP